MVIVQEYINRYHPLPQRRWTKKLDLRNLKLEGNGDLREFVDLEELNCSGNNIANLILPSNLRVLDCSGNNLTEFDFSVLNPNTLTHLRISNNNLSPRDLSCFSRLINLEVLEIGNGAATDKKFNRFWGSLGFLRDLRKLEVLDIQSTDICEGLNFLPSSVVIVLAQNDKRPGSEVLVIRDALSPYNFQMKKWRETHDLNYISLQTQLVEAKNEIKKLKNKQEEYEKLLIQWSEEIKTKETKEAKIQTEDLLNQGPETSKSDSSEASLIKEAEEKFGTSLQKILEVLLAEEKKTEQRQAQILQPLKK